MSVYAYFHRAATPFTLPLPTPLIDVTPDYYDAVAGAMMFWLMPLRRAPDDISSATATIFYVTRR